MLEDDGRTAKDYPVWEAFLIAYEPHREACLLLDAYLPAQEGSAALFRRLHDKGHLIPTIVLTNKGDVPTAVQAMRAGAMDVIERPVSRCALLASVEHALDQSRDRIRHAAARSVVVDRLACLTGRQREIMALVLVGQPSKIIAAELGISQRTVENHRASIMKKTHSDSIPALARLALCRD